MLEQSTPTYNLHDLPSEIIEIILMYLGDPLYVNLLKVNQGLKKKLNTNAMKSFWEFCLNKHYPNYPIPLGVVDYRALYRQAEVCARNNETDQFFAHWKGFKIIRWGNAERFKKMTKWTNAHGKVMAIDFTQGSAKRALNLANNLHSKEILEVIYNAILEKSYQVPTKTFGARQISESHKNEVIQTQRDAQDNTHHYWAACCGIVGVFQQNEWKTSNPAITAKDIASYLNGAIQYGHNTIVELILATKPDTNAVDHYNYSPLYTAMKYNNVWAVRALLAAGADKDNVKGKSFEVIDLKNPLLIACRLGSAEIVALLISSHANLTTTDRWENTVLHIATQSGNSKLIKLLLDAKVSINMQNIYGITPLLIAARNGRNDIIEMLLAAGADINLTDNCGNNALFEAIATAKADTVDLLLDNQIDLNHRCNLGYFATHHAALLDNADILNALLKKGAVVSVRNKKDETPLRCAISKGKIETVKVLLAKSTPREIADEENLYYLVVKSKNTKLVRILCDYNIAVDEVDINGETALHHACRNDDLAMVKELIHAGADLNILSNEGTPLELSRKHSHDDIIKILLWARADVNTHGRNDTVLAQSIPFGRFDRIALLLEAGADLSCQTSDDSRAISLAKNYNRSDIYCLLMLWQTYKLNFYEDPITQIKAIINTETTWDNAKVGIVTYFFANPVEKLLVTTLKDKLLAALQQITTIKDKEEQMRSLRRFVTTHGNHEAELGKAKYEFIEHYILGNAATSNVYELELATFKR